MTPSLLFAIYWLVAGFGTLVIAMFLRSETLLELETDVFFITAVLLFVMGFVMFPMCVGILIKTIRERAEDSIEDPE